MIYAFSSPAGTKTLVVEADTAGEAVDALETAGYEVDPSSMTMGTILVISASAPSTYVSEHLKPGFKR